MGHIINKHAFSSQQHLYAKENWISVQSPAVETVQMWRVELDVDVVGETKPRNRQDEGVTAGDLGGGGRQ